MKLRIAAVGRLGRRPETTLVEDYAKRLKILAGAAKLGPLEVIEVEDRAGKGPEAEADLLLKALPVEVLVALDEKGEALDSAALAARLGRWRDAGVASAGFAIGGADGHAPKLRAAARLTLSLGPMTLPHALARAVLAEQLYRAATILTGHPYHRSG